VRFEGNPRGVNRISRPRCFGLVARPHEESLSDLQKIIVNNQANRGGQREGSGRTTNYLKRCQLLAIQLHLLCSETTARRELHDNAGRLKGLVSPEHLDVLDGWAEMSEFNQGFVYRHLSNRVAANREAGWGTRL
jgi:hypothetical protein